MGKNVYSSKVRWAVVKDKLSGKLTMKEIMEKWVTDITYTQYGSTTKYLSTIMDLFNNEIIFYKLYDYQQTHLVIDALKIA